MATETKPSAGRIKSSNQDGSSKGKVDSSSVNKKNIGSSTRPHSADSKQLKSASNCMKTEVVKLKTTSSSSKTTTTTTTTTRVREKKLFTLAGQKFDPPEEREPLRIFYESLSKQIPTSEMAEFWFVFLLKFTVVDMAGEYGICRLCCMLKDSSREYARRVGEQREAFGPLETEGIDKQREAIYRVENDGPEGAGSNMDNTGEAKFYCLILARLVLPDAYSDFDETFMAVLFTTSSSLKGAHFQHFGEVENPTKMMEHGLLSPERAKRAYEKKQRRQKELRMGILPKTPNVTASKPESSQRQQQASKNGDAKAKKRIVKDSEDDDDFILSPKRRKG
ncbi:hypothetical protein JRO89_XS03G0272900 [Xanthoceras sorbifolium]|uniref:Uncharacterized protein n=1 Tax=Xanthoceras sorbifolium TaxID=99658 RepID=A0ABQ8IC89_9ROSI|nr:hypothetical protein JRO89_XS03G0272900 [Xanthoceras sorbifolium]